MLVMLRFKSAKSVDENFSMSNVTYQSDLDNVDWTALKATLQQDHFDNGRSPQQLETSFRNSYVACLAMASDRIIGTARALSDGVCNAYIVDIWTLTDFRRQGVASQMVRALLSQLEGQHVYLFTDDVPELYEKLGFVAQPIGMGQVVGQWLVSNASGRR